MQGTLGKVSLHRYSKYFRAFFLCITTGNTASKPFKVKKEFFSLVVYTDGDCITIAFKQYSCLKDKELSLSLFDPYISVGCMSLS